MRVGISIDRVSEQISTDIGEKDGQNLIDTSSADVLSGGNCFKWFSVTALAQGLFLCSSPASRIAMKTVTCIALFLASLVFLKWQ